MRLKQNPPDFTLFLVVLILICIGLIMVFSASAIKSSFMVDDPYHFVKRQLLWAIVGFGGMFVAMRFNYEKLARLGTPALILAVLFLIVVLLPGVGLDIKGSTRQINLGFSGFSPSELSKTCMALFLAANLSRHLDKIKEFAGGLLPFLVITGVICGLIMLQPDLGTTGVVACTAFAMLFMAGSRKSHMALLALAGIVLVAVAIQAAPYRAARFIAFLDPWKYETTGGFQTIQSLYAIGSGGLFGMGLGESRQKFFYLPEQHTDFIFAILGEELGYLGVMVVLTLFFIFAWRGFKIALKAPDIFGSLLAGGITTMIIVQAVINIGVVSGTLPVTGIPLPFISYGGSSLIFSLTAVGLILNVSRYSFNR